MLRGLQSVLSESSMPRKKARLTLPKRKPKKTTVTWEVRAILAEKTDQQGEREYLCDWEPDEHGKEYDPTWVKERDVGVQSLLDWEALKKQRVLEVADGSGQPSFVGPDVLPALRPGADNKRQREELTPSLDVPPHRSKRRRTDTVVEVALPANPAFDPREFAAIALASQTTIPDSQEQQDSFPSAAAASSNRGAYGSLVSPGPSSVEPEQQSQASQGDATRGPQAVSHPPTPPSPEFRHIHPDQTVSEPSAVLSFGERQVVTATNSQNSHELAPEVSAAESPSLSSEHSLSFQGFLTQPEFNFDTQPLNNSSVTAGSGAVIADSNGKSTAVESQESGGLAAQQSAPHVSHSAQIVQPLSSIPADLRVLSQANTQPSQSGVIPASSPGQILPANFASSSGAVAPEGRSGLSDVIVTDTPKRRVESESRSLHLDSRNQPLAPTSSGPSRQKQPIPPVLEEAVEADPSCTVSADSPRHAASEAVAGESALRLATPDPLPARWNLSLAVAAQASPRMEDIPDPALGGGNLEQYLLALHAHTVGSTPQRTDTLTPNKDGPERATDEPVSATLRPAGLSPAAQPETGHTTSTSDDVVQPSLPDDSHFGNSLALPATSGAPVPVDDESHHLPATIAPSQMFITDSSFHNSLPPAAQPLFRTEEVDQPETILPGIESRQPSADGERESSPSSVAQSHESQPSNVLVTLPMLASTRNLYVEAIRSHKSAIEKYCHFFTTESAGAPDGRLISEVDDIFRRLHDHCDLPQFADSIPALSTEAMMRHATGTSSKFSFVYELLMELKDSNLRVLVLSRPGTASDNLEAIYQTTQLDYIELDRYVAAGDDAEGLTVIHGTTDKDVFERPPPGVDAVILFDSTARQAWRDRSSGIIVLSLVVANSIEHIDLQLPHNLDDLERRSAIGFALAVSKSVISSPNRMQEPNELAVLFADFIKDPSRGLDWEPLALPAEFFDFYVSSQALESQRTGVPSLPNGRKRALDGDEGVSTPMKRARTGPPTLSQSAYLMSDLLKGTLAKYTPRPEGSSQAVEITIDQLEQMAARIARLEEEARDRVRIEERLQELVKRTERELNSYKKTVASLQPKYMAAISERGQFELAKNAADQRAAKLEEELQKSRAETEALKAKMAARTPSELEAKYQSALAEREKLEKKLQSASKDRDFFRDRFQEGMGTATEQASEIVDLRSQIQDLQRRASETAVRVHEINSRHMADEWRRQREEQAAHIAQLEQQVEQTRKELQALRSNRRETRASSVPRSPRLGVMSPRTRAGAGPAPGNTSRGNSPAPFDGSSTPLSAAGPVPGMTFYQPPGSHPRFSHLRE